MIEVIFNKDSEGNFKTWKIPTEEEESLIRDLEKSLDKNVAVILRVFLKGEKAQEDVLKEIPLSRAGSHPKYFRLYDDNNILYYEGIFWDDEEHQNQLDLLDWGGDYAGCLDIQISVLGERNGLGERFWKTEIK